MVELLEIEDALKRGRAEGVFAVKGMKDDAFEEVSQGEVVILGERFEYFQDAFFHADAGLDSLDLELMLCDEGSFHMYLCTRVCWYRQWGAGFVIRAHDEKCVVVATRAWGALFRG